MNLIHGQKRLTQVLGSVVLLAALLLPVHAQQATRLATDPGVGPVQLKTGGVVPPVV